MRGGVPSWRGTGTTWQFVLCVISVNIDSRCMKVMIESFTAIEPTEVISGNKPCIRFGDTFRIHRQGSGEGLWNVVLFRIGTACCPRVFHCIEIFYFRFKVFAFQTRQVLTYVICRLISLGSTWLSHSLHKGSLSFWYETESCLYILCGSTL
jgi:hypothetical protein